jgi:hypothetical protein
MPTSNSVTYNQQLRLPKLHRLRSTFFKAVQMLFFHALIGIEGRISVFMQCSHGEKPKSIMCSILSIYRTPHVYAPNKK